MSYFEQLLHFYSVVLDEAYDLETEFSLNRAKHIRKSLVQKEKQVEKLIHDYESSLKLVSFNNNIDTLNTIQNQLALMREINVFNQTVLAIDVKSKTGYYMFIKDIIAYSHLLP